ncbi:glycoside hydrolase [Mollisia scopiformis]|uniref:mannan endo-1,6-alpha-mannosidase n=1 Tax=Mollisia scopiformis TaxID=149040 RepID=A0A194XTW6_MOLSC|nr:glycoside hydrolase [Mollisia scopiformis]KUJ23653.1 glycoside hydrolase [Mollisia scopiformis]
MQFLLNSICPQFYYVGYKNNRKRFDEIYNGNSTGGTPGQLPFPPYYWWESGGLWACMIDYWSYTNDTTYNEVIEEGLLYQVGPNWDFMTPNQTLGMGNDDQGFWGMAAMTAAELNFQNPPSSGAQWLGLAQAVFNEFAARAALEKDYCGGGLRWQLYFWEDGWMYKNAISNACFFNLGARLARYTKNDTYAQIAENTWEWVTEIGLLELQLYSNVSSIFQVNGKGAGGYIAWDGATVESNCTGINGIPYTYNAGIFLLGAATMYNYTNESAIWANRTQLLLNATLNVFFPNGIAVEVSCEGMNGTKACDTDMLSFKAYLTRSLGATTQMAAFTIKQIMPVLATSAAAAALQCSGGANGRMCGLQWTKGADWDGS